MGTTLTQIKVKYSIELHKECQAELTALVKSYDSNPKKYDEYFHSKREEIISRLSNEDNAIYWLYNHEAQFGINNFEKEILMEDYNLSEDRFKELYRAYVRYANEMEWI